MHVRTSVRISKLTFGTQHVNLKHTVFHSNFISLTWQVQIHVVLMYTCSILIEHNITAGQIIVHTTLNIYNITAGQLQLCQHL